MKLIGSRTEQQLREELVRSKLSLRDVDHDPLAKTLKSAKTDIVEAYVINWIPEQAEDIYEVLVTPSDVMILEIPRGEGEIRIQSQTLADYLIGASKAQRLKIAVAQDLFSIAGSSVAG
jgi:hypothetical protein